MTYNLLWYPVIESLPSILKAALVTLQLSVFVTCVALLCAFVLEFFRRTHLKALDYFIHVWVELGRNTPALFQIYFFYFGLGSFHIYVSSYWSVFFALSFNASAYMYEIMRGAFVSLPYRYEQAALSLGMTNFQVMRFVILPQILKIVYGPLTNQFIWVMLMTSLGMIVGLHELSGEVQTLYSQSFRVFEFFSAAAVIYIIMAKSMECMFYFIGKWFIWR